MKKKKMMKKSAKKKMKKKSAKKKTKKKSAKKKMMKKMMMMEKKRCPAFLKATLCLSHIQLTAMYICTNAQPISIQPHATQCIQTNTHMLTASELPLPPKS